MEPYLLANKSALVTGAAQGIGLAIAASLARRGASVGIVDLKGAELTAESLSKQFPEQTFTGYELDVRDAEAVTATVGSFVEVSGGIDILVNNAGTAARIGIDEITAEQWQRDLDTNLGGTFNFVKAAVHPHMLDAGTGSIINISSISGINGGAMSDGEDYDTSNQALDRMGTPAEIAEAVAYLASDGAAFTTGQILRIDGGAVMS